MYICYLVKYSKFPSIVAVVTQTLYQRGADFSDFSVVPPVFIFSYGTATKLASAFYSCILFWINQLIILPQVTYKFLVITHEMNSSDLYKLEVVLLVLLSFLLLLLWLWFIFSYSRSHTSSSFPFWKGNFISGSVSNLKIFSFLCALKIWVEPMISCLSFQTWLCLSNAQTNVINSLWNHVLWDF